MPDGVPSLRCPPYIASPNFIHDMHLRSFLAAFPLCLALHLTALGQTAELQSTFTQGQLATTAAVFGIPSDVFEAEYDVNVYRVLYDMPYLGDTIEVSGALFVPQGAEDPCGLPLHVYMHGTIFKRNDAPSFGSPEGTFGGLMATLGQLVLMPDYVGLGTSQLMHPYVHARSESDAGFYMMKAAAELASELGYSLNGQNFISGYSQGGHAAMALARDLTTTSFGDSFTLTAAAPGSGPYDISGTQFPLTFDADTYSNPAYLAYNVIGWNSVYGTLYDELSEVFQEPYATTLPPLFDGTNDAMTINNACPPTLDALMQPGLVDEILGNPYHPFMIAAQDNDVYEWVPFVPIEMYYCTLDEQVFYQNTLWADAWMSDNGGSFHQVVNLGAYDHGQCAGFAILGATLWIESLVEECATDLTERIRPAVTMYPNPASDLVRMGSTQGPWQLKSLTGAVQKEGQGNVVDVSDVAAGMWLLTVDGHAPAFLSVVH